MQSNKVIITINNRKMFCNNSKCSKKTFAETFEFLAPNAKKSTRLNNEIINISMNVSSLAAEQIIKNRIANVGRSTICNLLKKENEIIDKIAVTKVCIDDFAMKKCHIYGTVMVDIETKRIIDLLDSRELDEVVKWLKTYPNLKIVSRDGSSRYAKAIRIAHPNAIQISDRFHLLKNLTDYFKNYITKTMNFKISIPTSFYWRHKILDAIRTFMGIGSVGGVIEVDEAFFRESFKVNHNKNTTFVMPRKSHKRGVKGSFSSKSEKRKRGISKEQVCVLCAMDRTGNLITELICKGRMKHTDLERLFTGRIEDEAILCTDSHNSYIQFAQNLGVELQQIKCGKHKEGIYHIQHINAFHSKLKKWMDRFNGVATKYLANYMYWFKWLEIFNTEKDTIKSKNLLVQSHTSHTETKLKDFRNREAIYI